MKIDIRIKLNAEDSDILKAFADLILDNCFVVKGLKLLQKNKYFVVMPSRRRQDGTFIDIAFPINNDTRKEIELKVLEAYEKELKRSL